MKATASILRMSSVSDSLESWVGRTKSEGAAAPCCYWPSGDISGSMADRQCHD